MRIDPKKCVACGNCIPVCPMGAIYIDPVIGRATINRDECVECFACFRGMSQEHLNPVLVRTVRKVLGVLRLRFEPEPDVCPTAAFAPDELAWPRVVRRAFSDPQVPHESTGVHGRGTEEVKTNDVTGRVKVGEVGFTVEFGRPGVGVRFRQIQEMTKAMAALGVQFEQRNPVTSLMTDQARGLIREDILDEKVLSAIVEVKCKVEQVPQVLDAIADVARRLETIVAVGAATRCDEEGEDPCLAPLLAEKGYVFHRAKTNIGLGRVAQTAPAPQSETAGVRA